MINDAARNQGYEDALRRAVRRHAASDPVAVLDIGAGTGLLAMYAAKVQHCHKQKCAVKELDIVNVPGL